MNDGQQNELAKAIMFYGAVFLVISVILGLLGIV
jgi:hypothetical protein